jgi:hypothetical protein
LKKQHRSCNLQEEHGFWIIESDLCDPSFFTLEITSVIIPFSSIHR